ncbi:MAG: hypothetical protein ACKV22_29555 [Bryobacteraceae bacterium]
MQRREFLSLALAAPTLAAEFPVRRVKVETAFKSPGPKPNGLQATSDGLWILDQGDNRAYLVSYDGGKVLRGLDTDSKAGSGITFDGAAIWLASTYSREIIQADAKTGKTRKKFDTPGAGAVDWPNPRRSPLAPKEEAKPAAAAQPAAPPEERVKTGAHGLEWRGGKLWLAVPPAKTIYRMDPVAWKIEFQFPTAGDRPHGLGWDGQWLWCADSNANAFHRYDPKTGKVSAQIQLADSDPLPHGMTIWKGWMWYCDDVGVVCRFKL